MLSVGKLSGGNLGYYLRLAREDYYLESGEPEGYYLGEGAKRFGLQGKVGASVLHHLFEGRAPDGVTSLRQIQRGSKKHLPRPGFDLTFSAPKSVSLLWAAGDAATRTGVEAAHNEAVAKGIEFLERYAAYTRVKREGKVVRERAGELVVAAFQHGTSRELDPQLHTHCLVFNVAHRKDGSYGTLDARDLYEKRIAAGTIYQSTLANRLSKAHGWTLSEGGAKHTFEVAGIPKTLIQAYSKRRKQIETRMKEAGYKTPAQAAKATLETRSWKKECSRKELFTKWQADLAKQGLTQEAIRSLAVTQRLPQDHIIDQTVRRAASDLAWKRLSFTQADLYRECAERTITLGAAPERIESRIQRYLRNSRHIVIAPLSGESKTSSLAASSIESSYTTISVRGVHSRLHKDVTRILKRNGHRAFSIAAHLNYLLTPMLSQQGREALWYLTRTSKDLACLSAPTTKETFRISRAASRVWKGSGYQVIPCSIRRKEAEYLEKYLGTEAMSVNKLLYMISPRSIWGNIEYNLSKEGIARSIRGGVYNRPFSTKPLLRLTRKHVLLIHGADRLGGAQMAELIRRAGRAGAKLVFVGQLKTTTKYHRWTPFQSLARKGFAHAFKPPPKVKEQHKAKQKQPQLKVVLTQNQAKAKEKLVSDWRQVFPKEPTKTHIFAPSKEEARQLNRLCQQALLDMKKLSGPPEFVHKTKLYKGDRICLNPKTKTEGVEVGDYGRVISYNRKTDELLVRVDRTGRQHQVLGQNLDGLELGYASVSKDAPRVEITESFTLEEAREGVEETLGPKALTANRQCGIYAQQTNAQEDVLHLAAKSAIERIRTQALNQHHENQL